MEDLSKIRIYRLTHYKNLPFILHNGLHCANSPVKDPAFINIGFQRLIESRGKTPVKVPPSGVLNDYVPFYFTPRSPMLFMINKGQVPDYKGIQEELIYLVSNVNVIQNAGRLFVFTDRHAKLDYAQHFNDCSRLVDLDWATIQSDNWGQQYGVLKKEKKQAEFLVYQTVPINLIQGIVCHNETIKNSVEVAMEEAKVFLPVVCRPKFYY
ncbi:DUF4433 domain-containing protein [Larkinella bovis]|uniref:DUF4433 domain-containing protein n=1 Tax=Larkinella bovis TaxID=683041 RepID=A0ABW0I6Z6_9BACT